MVGAEHAHSTHGTLLTPPQSPSRTSKKNKKQEKQDNLGQASRDIVVRDEHAKEAIRRTERHS
jgi:hypothetical protein